MSQKWKIMCLHSQISVACFFRLMTQFRFSECIGQTDRIIVLIQAHLSIAAQNTTFLFTPKNLIVVRRCYTTHAPRPPEYWGRRFDWHSRDSLQQHTLNIRSRLRIKFSTALHLFISVSGMKALTVILWDKNIKIRLWRLCPCHEGIEGECRYSST